ncbi:hypothetical protein [Victivallis sp. Marseille-Q1083]|uniref:hypothetical protein n=1 Tax=Victivallis sp. Marseille-Q1083 TaxID=2717288 RepID=UPI001588CBD8|nr:hypothetical protein [Victivallis sp. Marseille-Q1083]
MKLSAGTTEYVQAAYGYDGMSRLSQVSAFGQTAVYSRVSGANRLASTVFTASRSYDNFNRLTSVGGYGYVYDDRDQRTRLTLPDSQNWNHIYGQPAIGKWISRDPIEDQGGVNLYGFLGNDDLSHYDILGV